MKKILLVLASFALVTLLVISCNTPAEKVENAENDVVEAKEDLGKANQEYLVEIESYKKETAEKIEANDKSVAEFNARIKDEKQDAKKDYQNKIAVLEHKNSDMKKKMDDYQANGKANWEIFKREFSHDMDELGQSFKDLTVKNVK